MTPASAGRPGDIPPDGRRRVGGNDEERPPTLRDLPGVGTAIERRLREAGLTSVADLANANETELLERLADARGVTAERIREWIAAARDMSSAAPATEVDQHAVAREMTEKYQQGQIPAPPEPPERHESFVLTLSIDRPGNVHRSTIRHTRTGIEGTRQGWSPAHLATFIARHAGLATGEIVAAQTTPAGSTPGEPRPAPAPMELDLDAGHLIGGGHRSAHLAVAPPEIPWDVARYDYDLAVTAHQLGRRGWHPLGRIRGRATTGGELAVDIAAADLPPGIHRIVLTGRIRAVLPDSSNAAAPVEPGETGVALSDPKRS